jgi:hypothetical protein
MRCFAKKLTELVLPSNIFTQNHHERKRLFDDIYGYDNIKRLFRMALQSTHTSSILLSGPPASAKTLFLQCLMKLRHYHFIDCSNATKPGMVDYIFDNKPKYLLLDELDKLSRKDQCSLKSIGYDKDKTALNEYHKHYGEYDLPNTIFFDSVVHNKDKEKNTQPVPSLLPSPTALDLMFKRASSIEASYGPNDFDNEKYLQFLMTDKRQYHNIKNTSQYNGDKLLYELDDDKINLLKKTLKRNYGLYYKYLQKTDKHFYSNESA